jgi:hypothetical protein
MPRRTATLIAPPRINPTVSEDRMADTIQYFVRLIVSKSAKTATTSKWPYQTQYNDEVFHKTRLWVFRK